MKSKRVFRKNLFFQIICINGFAVFASFFPLCFWLLFMSIQDKTWWCILVSLCALVLCIFCWKIYVIPTVIPTIFGKLIITDEGVEYKCLFKKNAYISWDDCEYCGIESYHSDIHDMYMTGRIYVYFATKPIPRERQCKLDMMKNNNECIKFFPVDKKLCNEILLHKSASDIRRALFQNRIKW